MVALAPFSVVTLIVPGPVVMLEFSQKVVLCRPLAVVGFVVAPHSAKSESAFKVTPQTLMLADPLVDPKLFPQIVIAAPFVAEFSHPEVGPSVMSEKNNLGTPEDMIVVVCAKVVADIEAVCAEALPAASKAKTA